MSLHHNDQDKSIFLKAKFFEDCVALHFNPGGPVVQFQSVAWGMLMLVCCSLTASMAEYWRDYEEVAASTTNTRSLGDLLRRNCCVLQDLKHLNLDPLWQKDKPT